MDEELKFPEDYIARFDTQEFRKLILDIKEKIKTGYHLSDKVTFDKEIDKVIVCGMGGSAIAGLLLKDYLHELDLSLHVNQDYHLPSFANKKTLVIASSYSGNTEEVLSAYKHAQRKSCPTVCLTSGGTLQKLAKNYRTPVVSLPKGIPPRETMTQEFFALLKILEHTGIVESRENEVKKVIKEIKPGAVEKSAVGLSEKLVGKIPIIYASNKFGSVAYRWKTQMNENAKVHAFCNEFSELNHNEILGFENKFADFHVIILKFETDFYRNKKRMSITKKLIEERGTHVTEIEIKGKDILTAMFNSILLGDLTSYYLTLRYALNPFPVKIIEELKKDLGTFI